MASVEDGIAAQVRNIEARYGRPLPEWFGIIAASGLTKHTEVVAMLKADYGMAHGAAHRVSLLSRQAAVPDGPRAGLRPRRVRWPTRCTPGRKRPAAAARRAHGRDPRPRSGREPGPQEGVRQPAQAEEAVRDDPAQRAGRIDLGLILPGVLAAGRLEPAGSFNALFTHRVRVTSAGDLDDALAGWLAAAYTAAG